MTLSTESINVDRTQAAVVHGMQLAWMDSPAKGVQRKMLERIGGEVALATSIVRYAPGSIFNSHVHELGEEFLVLDGTFSDEHGNYPAGTYVRNPPGSLHTPFSKDGCTIFVKLRQMTKDDTYAVTLLPGEQRWETLDTGVYRSLLCVADSTQVELIRMEAGSKLVTPSSLHGEELFVVCGSVRYGDPVSTMLTQWSWVRNPGEVHCVLVSDDGTVLWVKRGHLHHEESET